MNRRILLAAVAACGLFPALAQATVLTFEGLGTNTPIPDGYGDAVSAEGPAILRGNGFTPNVSIDFVPNGGDGFQTYNDPDWQAAQLDGSPGAGYFDVVFTPDDGYGVIVNSFEFDDYAEYAQGHTFDWVLIGNDKLLAGATGVVVAPDVTTDPTGADNLVVNTGMTAPFAGPLTLRITPTSGDAFDRAIDDVNFDQRVIPEPASLGLAAACGAMMLLRRRRHI
jgi:hypothetical protein